MAKEQTMGRQPVLCGVRVEMNVDKIFSERDILEQVKGGNREAYGEIVKKYMKSAYYIAFGFVHNHQDALDLSQEAFIKAFRNIKRFETEKAFFPWFYKLMKNLCLDFLRKKRRRSEYPLAGVEASGDDSQHSEVQEMLWKAVAELPFEQKEVVILRYFQQLSYRELAEMTGKPVGTVMSSLYYAKRKLKEIVAKYSDSGQKRGKVI